jgi:hypothetical protein
MSEFEVRRHTETYSSQELTLKVIYRKMISHIFVTYLIKAFLK